MGKRKDFSTEQKSSVIAFIRNTEHSQRNIARKCLSKKVQMNQPVTAARAGNCGRKLDLRKRFQETGFSGSVATVRRNLYSMGFKYRRPIKKLKLTPTMAQKRLTWANLHKDMSLEDWQTVYFSDEATFQIMDNRAQFIRRRPIETYNMDCAVKTVKRPASVMIWSVITAKEMGRLYVIEGTMRQDQYRKVLETKLLPQLQEWFGNGRKVFMQDGNPVLPNATEFSNTIILVHTIGGEGFDDLLFEDIDELLIDKALSEDEIIEVVLEAPDSKEHSDKDDEDPILNTDLIKEGLELASKLGNHFVKHDPNEERAEKFQRDLKSLMSSYRELYNGLAKTQTQRLITEFVLKSTETSAPQEASPNFVQDIIERISPMQHEDDNQDISSDSSNIAILPKRMRLLSESDNE
ncbi:Transposable element Tc1 transposase [Anthophora plagiata]